MNKSRKVYLIYTSNSRMYPYFPSSSLAVAGPLLKTGYTPKIVDTELENWKNIDFSDGLCACISTFTGPWLGTALKIAKHLRKYYPSLKIFWGGPHAIALPEVTAKHFAADAVCYTEGENVITELVNSAFEGNNNYQNIKGIIFRDSSGKIIRTGPPDTAEMDNISLPPYEILNNSLYTIKSGKIYYQSSRGCVFKCRFCACENRSRWRGMSADKTISDLRKIVELFNPEEIQFFDGNFFVNLNRVRDICAKKIELGLKFKWSAYCRFDTFAKLSDSDLLLLKNSGCCELKFGGESGSARILEYLDKETKPGQITEGVRRCRQYGITPTLSFMTGFPKETREDLRATLTIIKSLRRDYPGIDINGLFLLQHLPNTPLTDEVIRDYGIKQPDNLEDWVNHHLVWTKRSDYPWMSGSDYSFRKTLASIVNYLYISDVVINMPETQRKGTFLKSKILFGIFKFVDIVIRKIFVPLRWEKEFTFLPIEWRVWDFVRKNILRTV